MKIAPPHWPGTAVHMLSRDSGRRRAEGETSESVCMSLFDTQSQRGQMNGRGGNPAEEFLKLRSQRVR